MNSLGADRRLNRHYEPETKPGMKWHKFLIYVSLWLSALSSMGNAVTYASGAPYGAEAAEVYAWYPGLSILDKAMAAACVVLAVYAIVTRFALAGMRASGPKKLLLLLAANLALNVFYLILFSVITAMPVNELFDSSSISSLAVTVALLFYNKRYYSERSELFVN